MRVSIRTKLKIKLVIDFFVKHKDSIIVYSNVTYKKQSINNLLFILNFFLITLTLLSH